MKRSLRSDGDSALEEANRLDAEYVSLPYYMKSEEAMHKVLKKYEDALPCSTKDGNDLKIQEVVGDIVPFVDEGCQEVSNFEKFISMMKAINYEFHDRSVAASNYLILAAIKRALGEYTGRPLMEFHFYSKFDAFRLTLDVCDICEHFFSGYSHLGVSSPESEEDFESCNSLLIEKRAWGTAYQLKQKAAATKKPEMELEDVRFVVDDYKAARVCAEASKDIALQGEITYALGKLYFEYSGNQRAFEYLRHSVYLGLSVKSGGQNPHTSFDWFSDALEYCAMIKDDAWVRDQIIEEETVEAAKAELDKDVFPRLVEEAKGGPIIGALKLITYILEAHPPKVENVEKMNVMREALDKTDKSMCPRERLNKCLNHVKVMYHTDQNIGRGDLRWRLICERITMQLNEFKKRAFPDQVRAENAERRGEKGEKGKKGK